MPKPTSPQFESFHHASLNDPSEFMAAPTLHVGTEDAAEHRKRDIQGFSRGRDIANIYKITPSQHLDIHPEMLDDMEANTADARYLRKNNYPVSADVFHSSSGWNLGYQSARRVVAGARALKQNKALQYINEGEDKGSRALIIPSPHFNAAIGDNPEDPLEQPVLPMDYSPIKQSYHTQEYREAEDHKRSKA
jgi:hypothetical protein